uniref:Dystroglycan C-terminal domain-containing protein n=1 Tax=Mycena chlorophos TaxID=658473 RepID=A0ABQ0L4C0_MYCCL|nr:predicted protein [Mycena chlorophos]
MIELTTTITVPPTSNLEEWAALSREWADLGETTPFSVVPGQTVVFVVAEGSLDSLTLLEEFTLQATTTGTPLQVEPSTSAPDVPFSSATAASVAIESGFTGTSPIRATRSSPSSSLSHATTSVTPATNTSVAPSESALPSSLPSEPSPSPSNLKSTPNAALTGGVVAAAAILLISIAVAIFLWRRLRHGRTQALVARPNSQVARKSLESTVLKPLLPASEGLGGEPAVSASRLAAGVTSAITRKRRPPRLISILPAITLPRLPSEQIVSAPARAEASDPHPDAVSTSSGASDPKPIDHRQFRALMHRVQELELEAQARARAETEMPVEPPPGYT